MSTAFKAAICAQKAIRKIVQLIPTKISLGENSTNTEAALKLGLPCLSVALQRRLLVSIFWTCWKAEHGSCNSAAQLPPTNTQTALTTCSEQTSAAEGTGLAKGKALGSTDENLKASGFSLSFFPRSQHCVIYEIPTALSLPPQDGPSAARSSLLLESEGFLHRDARCWQTQKLPPRLLPLCWGRTVPVQGSRWLSDKLWASPTLGGQSTL